MLMKKIVADRKPLQNILKLKILKLTHNFIINIIYNKKLEQFIICGVIKHLFWCNNIYFWWCYCKLSLCYFTNIMFNLLIISFI